MRYARNGRAKKIAPGVDTVFAACLAALGAATLRRAVTAADLSESGRDRL